MLFTDSLSFDHPRKTSDGYMVVRARAARAGIYDYLGSEIDPEGTHFRADQMVKVYRSEAEVFAQDSVASFLMKPVTNDHPSTPVTAANWRDNAKGVVGKALRDGDYLAFDIVLMDKGIIDQVESGKRELSNGYSSLIDFTSGQTATGEHYDAVQKQIRGNHVAVVKNGRAGPMCRIGDAAPCAQIPASELIEILTDEQTYSGDSRPNKTGSAHSGGSHVATKIITFDGLPLEVTDAAEAAIGKLQGQIATLTADKAKAEGDVATLTTDKSTLEAKVTTLEQAVTDAKLSPQQLRDAAKAFAQVCDKAKALGVEVADTMDEAAIRKAVVNAKLGDKAKDWTDEQIAISFDTITASVKVDDATIDPVRNALSGGLVNVGDAKAEFDKVLADNAQRMRTAHQGSAPAPAA